MNEFKTVKLEVSETKIFESRNGAVPKDTPDCGFMNEFSIWFS